MLKLKYKPGELKRLGALYEKYDALPYHSFGIIEVVETWEAIRVIEDRVENEAIEYYKEHLSELENDILEQFRYNVIQLSQNNPEFKFGESFLSLEIANFNRFLSLLPNKEEIKEKICEIFEHRREYLGTPNAEHYTPKTSKLLTKKPKEYISPNTKVSNEIFSDSDFYYNGFKTLAVERQARQSGKKATKEINVTLSLQYDNDREPKIKLVGKYKNTHITNFDRIVHDAVVTQFIDGGNRYITTDMIAYVINGGKDTKNKALRDAINESMDRLFYTTVEIDAKEKAEIYGFDYDDSGLKGHILDFDLVWATVNGQRVQCMDFSNKTPILYRYANALGQVLRSDLKLLDVPQLQNYPENIELKNYLLHRIEILLYNTKQKRIIRYDSIYKLLNVTAKSDTALRMKKRDIRKKVKMCLDYWIKAGQDVKNKSKITGYKEIKEAREITKIELEIFYPKT